MLICQAAPEGFDPEGASAAARGVCPRKRWGPALQWWGCGALVSRRHVSARPRALAHVPKGEPRRGFDSRREPRLHGQPRTAVSPAGASELSLVVRA
jgi:hypothetical protein